MASSSIRRLLDAEKDAQILIGDAKKKRAERLKLAKADADREITGFRQELETDLGAKKQEISSSTANRRQLLQQDTLQKIQSIRSKYESNKDSVASFLLNCVSKVE